MESRPEKIDVRTKELNAGLKTVNEFREDDHMCPLPWGDIPSNPTLAMYYNQQKQMEAQQAMGGAPGGAPGGEAGPGEESAGGEMEAGSEAGEAAGVTRTTPDEVPPTRESEEETPMGEAAAESQKIEGKPPALRGQALHEQVIQNKVDKNSIMAGVKDGKPATPESMKKKMIGPAQPLIKSADGDKDMVTIEIDCDI